MSDNLRYPHNIRVNYPALWEEIRGLDPVSAFRRCYPSIPRGLSIKEALDLAAEIEPVQ